MPLAGCIAVPSPWAPSTSRNGFIASGSSAMCDWPSVPLYTRHIFGMLWIIQRATETPDIPGISAAAGPGEMSGCLGLSEQDQLARVTRVARRSRDDVAWQLARRTRRAGAHRGLRARRRRRAGRRRGRRHLFHDDDQLVARAQVSEHDG